MVTERKKKIQLSIRKITHSRLNVTNLSVVMIKDWGEKGLVMCPFPTSSISKYAVKSSPYRRIKWSKRISV